MRSSLLLLASCFNSTHAFGIVPDSRSGVDVSTPCQKFFQGDVTPLSAMEDSAGTALVGTCAAIEGRDDIRLRAALGTGSSDWCGGSWSNPTSSDDCSKFYVHNLIANEDGVEGEQQVAYTLCAWSKDDNKCKWDVSTTTACSLAPTSVCNAFAAKADDTELAASRDICGGFSDAASCESSVSRTEGTDRFHVCKWKNGSCKNLDGPFNCPGRRALQGRALSEADPCESAEEAACTAGAFGYPGDDFALPTGDYANAPPAPELHVCTWNKDTAKCETDYKCPYSCAMVGTRYVPTSSGSDVKVSYGETAIDDQRFCTANVEVGGSQPKCGQHFEARKAGESVYGLEPCVWGGLGQTQSCTKYSNLGYNLPACV